jgi:hypothetical protein
MTIGWTAGDVLRRLRLPRDFVPASAEEADAVWERAIDLLRNPNNRSGFQQIYPVRKRWQAKPYTDAGEQVNLGSFDEPRHAALALLCFHMGGEQLLPKGPPRKKRGTGEQPQRGASKRVALPAARASPSSVLSEQLVLEVDAAPDARGVVVSCEPVPCVVERAI